MTMTFTNLEAIAQFTGKTVAELRAHRRDMRAREDTVSKYERGDIATWQLKALGAKRVSFKLGESPSHPWKTTPVFFTGGHDIPDEYVPKSAHWLGQLLRTPSTLRMAPFGPHDLRAVWVRDQTQLTLLQLTLAVQGAEDRILSMPRFDYVPA
jgi:hypothetical protein